MIQSLSSVAFEFRVVRAATSLELAHLCVSEDVPVRIELVQVQGAVVQAISELVSARQLPDVLSVASACIGDSVAALVVLGDACELLFDDAEREVADVAIEL